MEKNYSKYDLVGAGDDILNKLSQDVTAE